MGKWAESTFGKSKFASVGIVVAGTSKPEFEKEVLSLFDEVILSKDKVYHAHIVKKNGKYYPLVFNVYGAPAMVDVLAVMHDGGCRNVIFVGHAYGGFKNHTEVGAVVIPDKSFHFDGLFNSISSGKKFSVPDIDLMKKLENLLTKNKTEYVKGSNISVPAVTLQRVHANKEYASINPISLEMELASCYARSREIGMRSVGCLIISDNKHKSLRDAKENLYKSKMYVLKLIIGHLKYFNLPKIKVKKEFNIDSHLADIISKPGDKMNVYRMHK